ncbi:MAG TPA: GNAT family N-acyltransferase [Bryobacteraceae bacterium]|nr:GNAT family N-acyltransferase [Bryobacteraceae bacterium]
MPELPVAQSPSGQEFKQVGLDATFGVLSKSALRPFAQVLERWFEEDFARLGRSIPPPGERFFHRLLENLHMRYDCDAEDVQRIPRTGPVILTANHPFGFAEGVLLGALLDEIRPDFRFMANSLLLAVPQLRDYLIPLNPYGGPEAVRENRTSLRRAIECLQTGELLVAFPAGDVATFQFARLGIHDREWTGTVARLARKTNASVLPVFFHGANSAAFHVAGLVHERLRTVLLPREFLNKQDQSIRISIGGIIRPERLAQIGDIGAATEYLRSRTVLLESRENSAAAGWNLGNLAPRPAPAMIAVPQESALMEQEVSGLMPAQCLVRAGEYAVCVAPAQQIPHTLLEIGRLREITFRRAGEGTGRPADLDACDPHYEHLFLWNEEKREVAGAYRLAKIDEILARHGLHGLYTSTLFRLEPGFYESIHPALELGRSFVRPEYQKSYLPLLLLWKGLGQYVARNPQYRILFGPASISDTYSPASRTLMVSFLKARHRNEHLAGYVQPRKQFRIRNLTGCHPDNFSALLENLDELSEVVADLEPDHKGLPILLQHYLNLGGQVLDFNVDRKFSNCIDGLVLVDLAKAKRRQLERYMGKVDAERFLQQHET